MQSKKPFSSKKKITGGSVTGKSVEIPAADVITFIKQHLIHAIEVPQHVIDAEIDNAVDWCVRDLWKSLSVEFVDGDIQVSHLCNWFEVDPLRRLCFSLSDLLGEAADQAEEDGLSEAFLSSAEKELSRCLRLVQARRQKLKNGT